jgi:hypothetical protein
MSIVSINSYHIRCLINGFKIVLLLNKTKIITINRQLLLLNLMFIKWLHLHDQMSKIFNCFSIKIRFRNWANILCKKKEKNLQIRYLYWIL